MAKNQESINRSLFELLRSRGYAPTLLDTSGKEIPVPEEAEVFQFKFSKDGEEYGTVTASIDGLHKLVIYFGDDVANSEKEDNGGDDSWYKLLNHLKRFSQQHQLSFEVKNRDHLKYDMAKREHMKKQEKIAEGYYPMGKKASYNDNIPTVKIVIEHSRTIEEGEQRYRNVNRIFLENTQGERILAPTTKPGVAQIYARHLAEGGMPHDDRWNHIISLCEEYNKMGAFVRATRNNQFNESAQQLVNEGINHYQSLRESLSKMRGTRGYNAYFESYTPPLMEDETEENNLNELFVQETLDPRIESVMPILNKLHKKVAEMKEVNELSEWADNIIDEGAAVDAYMAGKSIALAHFADQLDKNVGKDDLGIDEGAEKSIIINGKEVDKASLEVDGVDPRDYPDFSDAYFSAGSFTDGTPLNDEEIDQLSDQYGDLLYDKAYDSLHEGEQEMDEGIVDTIKKFGGKVKDVASTAFDNLGGGTEEQLIKKIQKDAGVEQTGKKPEPKDKPVGEGMLDRSREQQAAAKIEKPAVHRKEQGGDWKVTPDDLKMADKKNMTSPDGMAQLKKELGNIDEVDMGQADSSLRSNQKQSNDKMDHFTALDKASKKMGHNHFMDVPDDKLEALRAMVKKFRAGEEVDESALQASFGIKKYGEDGMKELQRLGREDASKETIAKAKAEYTSEDVENEFAGDYATGETGQWRNKGPKANKPATIGDLVGEGEEKDKDDTLDPWKHVNPRVDNPEIKGTKNKAKSAYYPEPKPPVKKLDTPYTKESVIEGSDDLARILNIAGIRK